MSKYILRVPTNEQYAYVEESFEGSAEEAVEAYRSLTKLVKGGEGLPDSEWRDVLDNYLYGSEHMEAEQYIAMNPDQQKVIQEIKKSRKRINYTNTKGEIHHSLQ